MNNYVAILAVIVGVFCGLLVSIKALGTFRAYLIHNTKPCCAKCIHCNKSTQGFTCKKTGSPVRNLLVTHCENFKF